ncbi:magnesium/cobalt transporter CorA [Kaustia mangrovi]|uniref:Magnesium transport protein CorA n=1 Tax=Kaustia mangrovi TaxID=2593653 RepID=A0A7S8C4Q1_9HYPH|nr:magnesium/cobalt transporter CorA [Kaustia mangrovi]QPC43282.1 magnesium/cobalt transporter CorA [Kaustia mangrovi]
MITAYVSDGGALAPRTLTEGEPLPDNVVWIDLFQPTCEEEKAVEEALGLEVPTREDMAEIEASSRLYQEGRALFMTAAVLAQAESDTPTSDPVTFMLVDRTLVTLRYIDPQPFKLYASQCQKPPSKVPSGEAVLAGLLDAVVDRIADVLEMAQRDLDVLAKEIFAREHPDETRRDIDYEDVLRRIGLAQGITNRVRESLLTISRLATFLNRPGVHTTDKTLAKAFKTLVRDVQALNDHVAFLAGNINFLLDATLGMINIEQTGIIKIFSVAAVVFLPPTLIASIYGMNFNIMPELDWTFGYPFAIVLMIVSAILPYLYFKRKGWL